MKKSTEKSFKKGFSLIELIAIATILAILAGVMVYPAYGLIERARLKAEQETLLMIAEEIKKSFRTDGLLDNISALEEEIPSGGGVTLVPTVFDYAWNESFDTEAWYARLARLRGQASPSGFVGPAYDIAYNAYKNRRLLFVGPSYPADENIEMQTYFLVSFMFRPDEGLTFPSAPNKKYYETSTDGLAYTTWYKQFYDHDWSVTGNAPSGWDSNWGNTGLTGLSFAQKVLVVKIVQPRYRMTVNNHSQPYTDPVTGLTTAADSIWVYTNIVGESGLVDSPLWLKVNSGESTSFPTSASARRVLEGRRVVVKRAIPSKTNPGDQKQIYSFLLNEPTSITTQ